MKKVTAEQLAHPESIALDSEVIAFRKQFEAVSSLDEIVRIGARQMRVPNNIQGYAAREPCWFRTTSAGLRVLFRFPWQTERPPGHEQRGHRRIVQCQ